MGAVLAAIVTIVAGVLIVLFRRPLARFTVAAQNWTWGFKFGHRTVRFTENFAAPATGAAFILAGIIFLFLR